MEQKVSVVIPTYNRENALPRAVNSVINQTYKNWGLLIVDDGSTDNTKQLIRENFGDNSRINLSERPSARPKGANACRNIGMEKANGKYVALLDSDDEWKPNHLERCIQIAEDEEEFYGCYAGTFIKRGKYLFKKESRQRKSNETHFDFLLNGGHAQTSSYFLLRNAGLEVTFDESLQRHQDWDFFIRFGEKYSWIYNNNMQVIHHREVDATFKKIDFDSCISFYKKHQNRIKNIDNRKRYLYGQYKKAVVKGEKSASKFYKKELKSMGFEQNIPINYPAIYRIFEWLKSKLQINRARKMAKFYIKGYR